MTVHFLDTSFMLAFLRGANTARSVSDVFDGLYSLLGIESFKLLFPVILTDNGSEFSAPMALEKDAAVYGAAGYFTVTRRLRSKRALLKTIMN